MPKFYKLLGNKKNKYKEILKGKEILLINNIKQLMMR
jgi:hypothetical protein